MKREKRVIVLVNKDCSIEGVFENKDLANTFIKKYNSKAEWHESYFNKSIQQNKKKENVSIVLVKDNEPKAFYKGILIKTENLLTLQVLKDKKNYLLEIKPKKEKKRNG